MRNPPILLEPGIEPWRAACRLRLFNGIIAARGWKSAYDRRRRIIAGRAPVCAVRAPVFSPFRQEARSRPADLSQRERVRLAYSQNRQGGKSRL
jgi:hypothetical protein